MNAPDAFAFRPVRWPLILAGLAMLAAIAMLAGAAWDYKYAQRIAAPPAASAAAAPTPDVALAKSPMLDAPPSGMYLSDLGLLFKLAGEKHLLLNSVEYRAEANRPAGLVLQHVVLQLDDEYPKVKTFVAELLREMPHAQLEEIEIEQASTSQLPLAQAALPPITPRLQATLKIAFLYRADDAGGAGKQVAKTP